MGAEHTSELSQAEIGHFTLAPAYDSVYMTRVMARTVTLRDVMQRRKDIAAKIADLQAEDAELEVATRALSRLLDRAETPLGEAMAKAAPAAGARWGKPGVPKPGIVKPEDIPTVPQMIKRALKEAALTGATGQEPREITAFIKKTWWPQADINKVGPIAWRMWKRKELSKRGSKYSLLKDETPSGREGVSEVTGEVDASPNENRNGLFGRNG